VCIIAADRTKFHRNAFVKIADINSADYIVTTGNLTKEDKISLEKHGITLVLAK